MLMVVVVVCVCVCVPREIREQLAGVSSLFVPCSICGFSWSPQTCAGSILSLSHLTSPQILLISR